VEPQPIQTSVFSIQEDMDALPLPPDWAEEAEA
jgi:hypothetical protein